ncbi:MAG: hypothetical protein V1853_03990 [bacterium]
MDYTEFKIAKIIREASEVITLSLTPTQPIEYKYSAGMFTMVKIPETHLPARAFSFSSSPSDSDIELTIEKTGLVTSALHDLEVGSRLLLSQPKGKFILPDEIKEDLVFIAGGSGIAPIRSLIKYLQHIKFKKEIKLYYCTRKSSDIIFRKEFEELDKCWPQFSLLVALTQEPPDSQWTGQRERMNQEQIAVNIKKDRIPLFYLCGSPQLVISIIKELADLGVPRENIVTEQWLQPVVE